MEGIKKGLRKALKRQEYLDFLPFWKRCKREARNPMATMKEAVGEDKLQWLHSKKDKVACLCFYLFGGVGAWTQVENCLR